MIRRRLCTFAVAAVFTAVVAAGACGDDDGGVVTPPGTTSTGHGGGGGAGGESLGIPSFGDARTLVGGQFRPTRLVLSGSHLYWTTQGGTAGGGAAPLGGAGGAGGAAGAGGSGAIGAGGGGGSGEIVILGAVVRVNKTGGTPATIATAPSVTALTVAEDAVFFAVLEETIGRIEVVSASGGASQTLLDGLGWPADVAVDADRVYWTEVGTEGGLWSAPRPAVDLDAGAPGGGSPGAAGAGQGGSAATQIYAGSALLTFLRIDDDTLYFSDHGVAAHEGSIGAVDLSSQDTDLRVEGIDRPRYFTFDDTHLYVVTEGDGRVHRFYKSGGAAAVLAYDQDRPYGIAVDERAVYWTNSATTPPAGDCESANGSIMAKPHGGGDIVELAANQACPLAIAVDDTGLYWVNMGRDSDPSSGAVMRMPKR